MVGPATLPYQQLPAALDSLEAEANQLLQVCGYPTAQASVLVQKTGGRQLYMVWAPDPAKVVGTLAQGTGHTPGEALADFAARLTPAALTYGGAQL